MAETSSKEYILGVGGMTCNGCANNVKNALSSVSGVSNVDVDLECAKATVYTYGTSNIDYLYAAVAYDGYSIH